MSIHKIVFTGGPCAGKSKVIKAIAEKLRKDEYTVIVVPETAAELIEAGIMPNDNYLHTLMFQELVLNHQLVKEKSAETYANFVNKENDIIILYDRAVLDNAAYFPNTQPFEDLLKKYGIKELEQVDEYNFVIDLVSLSSLRPDLYVNDKIRKEKAIDAALLDRKTTSAWLLADNLKIIKPMDTMQEKIDYVYNTIINYVKGLGMIEETRQKIDLNKFNPGWFNYKNSKKLEVVEYTLNNPTTNDIDYKVYERKYKDAKTYILKTIKKVSDNKDIILSQRKIELSMFLEILKQRMIEDMNAYQEIKYVDSEFNRFTIDTNFNEGIIKMYSDDTKIPTYVKSLK